eukprot:3512868-Prymnesium_polylepis.2
MRCSLVRAGAVRQASTGQPGAVRCGRADARSSMPGQHVRGAARRFESAGAPRESLRGSLGDRAPPQPELLRAFTGMGRSSAA